MRQQTPRATENPNLVGLATKVHKGSPGCPSTWCRGFFYLRRGLKSAGLARPSYDRLEEGSLRWLHLRPRRYRLSANG